MPTLLNRTSSFHGKWRVMEIPVENISFPLFHDNPVLDQELQQVDHDITGSLESDARIANRKAFKKGSIQYR